MLKSFFFFFVSNGPRGHELEKELENCTQQGVVVVDYFGKLTTIWDELMNYEKYLNYCCGGQICKLNADGKHQ